LFRDPLVERLNFSVKDFEIALTSDTVLASCGRTTRLYCLNKLLDEDAAIVITAPIIHAVMRHPRVPKV